MKWAGEIKKDPKGVFFSSRKFSACAVNRILKASFCSPHTESGWFLLFPQRHLHPDHHRDERGGVFRYRKRNGRGQLPKALEIGRQNAFQQGGNEGRRLLHIPKKENARHGFLIRGCDLLLIDLRRGGQMRQRTEAVDDGSDICFQIRRAIQYPKERIKRRDFFI